jgi:hypothetical protein
MLATFHLIPLMEPLDVQFREVVLLLDILTNTSMQSSSTLISKKAWLAKSHLWTSTRNLVESSIGTTTETFITSFPMPLLTYNVETTLINGPLWETGLLLHATESFLFPLSLLILFQIILIFFSCSDKLFSLKSSSLLNKKSYFYTVSLSD